MAINAAQVEEVIRENLDTTLIRPLEETSKFLALGAKIVSSSAPITFPKLVAGFNVARYGESEQIAENTTGDVFDASLRLMPSDMESYKGLIRLSNESLRMASVALDAVLSNRLVRDFQRAIDADAFSAAGDGIATPRGIFHEDWGIPEIDLAGSALTYDVLFDAVGALMGADAPTTGLKWLLDPGALTSLRKVKDQNGRYILDENVAAAPGGATLLGIPVVVTKRLAAGETGKRAMLLNPSSLVIVRDNAPTVKVLTERYADYDETGLRVTARYDWGFIEPDANVVIDGIA